MNRRDFIAAGAALAVAGGAWTTAQAAPSGARAPLVLVVGDSLSAEYGLARGTGWVALLQGRLAQESPAASVVNASISGDTTSGGLVRLPALLKAHRPTHVVLELGGNDALRGLPLKGTEDNLARMVQLSQQAGARVLLLGMQIPPNFGTEHARRFNALFDTVAKRHRAALVPFFLQGVADGPDPLRLFQADRIHPNAQAQPLMLANVWPELKKLLRP